MCTSQEICFIADFSSFLVGQFIGCTKIPVLVFASAYRLAVRAGVVNAYSEKYPEHRLQVAHEAMWLSLAVILEQQSDRHEYFSASTARCARVFLLGQLR